MPEEFGRSLTTPMHRELRALCAKHGVTRFVAAFEDPDQVSGATTVHLKMSSTPAWARGAAGSIYAYVEQMTDDTDNWRKV